MTIRNRILALLLMVIGLAAFGTRATGAVNRITEFNVGGGSEPGGITVGSDGNLWFTEIGGNSVDMITPEGAITRFPLPQSFSFPFDITTGPDGALWFTENLSAVGKISTSGSQNALASYDPSGQPTGIVSGPDGALWYVERLYNAVVRLTPSGSATKYLVPTSETFGTGLFYIAAGSDDAFWITDTYGNTIWRMTTSGSVTGYPIPTANCQPERIASGFDGALWFAENEVNQIARITTGGSITEFPLPSANSEPYGITTGPDQAMWFTEQGRNRIGRITASGAIEEFAIPTSHALPSDIVTGPDGALWFTEYGSGKIGRLTPPGPPTAATMPATGVAITTAALNGLVNPNGSATSAFFEYGADTSYGMTTAAKNIGKGLAEVKVTAKVAGLQPETTYHFRVDASSANGTVEGVDQTFTTSIGKPDASIGFSIRAMAGEDVINANGSGQTLSASVAARHSKTCLVGVTNESSFTDSVLVHGDSSNGRFIVKYFYGTANVTNRVVAGTFAVPNIRPGLSRTLRVVATVNPQESSGESDGINITITSASSPTAIDEVRYEVTVQ